MKLCGSKYMTMDIENHKIHPTNCWNQQHVPKKTLKSGFELKGIAPNRLIQAVENTAPFIFTDEIKIDGKKREFLKKLKF